MLNKKIIIIFISFLLYQSPLLSKSTSFNEFNSKELSKYFSGIVAFENENNSQALDFFNSSKILINRHKPFLEKLVISLVLEGKVQHAINYLKNNKKNNSEFFEAHILLALDSLKRNDLNKTIEILSLIPDEYQADRFNLIIVHALNEYANVFKNKKITDKKDNFGTLSLIFETFQRCYLNDENTDTYFSKLINDVQIDYSRYIFFYLTYLIEKKRIEDAKAITDELDYINSTLLLSQGKSWIERNQQKEFGKVFSCNNHNDITGEFLFLISNLFSSQNQFEKSNFYLSLSNYLNPKFVFNLSLVSENFFSNKNYEKSKIVLKNFDRHQDFYYWYKSKKEAQIISKTRNREEGLNHILSKFKKIENPNNKFIFDIANFYKNSQRYEEAIKYYSLIIDKLEDDNELKAELLYRRGGSHERMKDYYNADKDLQKSLVINPDDSYVLNYLAYSWLERGHRIEEAIEMLEKAYDQESNDPYIIDSIGWAYYLIGDYVKAEEFLRKAVQLMPDDPIVNDHYGDILWKLERKIQARYFWSIVLKMDDAEKDLLDKIKNKLITGLQNS
tara:strand:- start:730 stop:2412 length:1683 start_codon:yes stop_codon:yes gene_type:complete